MEIIDLRTIRPPDEIGLLKRAALKTLLAPLSGIYALAMRTWRSMPARAVDPGVPVISIGSISVGGTGKTPLAIAVARRFTERGVRVCILSRGYKRRSAKSPLVVSNRDRVLTSVEEAGDEPHMMAKRLPGVGVIVGKNRLQAARVAAEVLGPELLILDDGFQYRRIAKSAEIVCLDPACLRPGAAMLPVGPLREGLSSVAPEHIVVIALGPGDDQPGPEDIVRMRSRNVFFSRRPEPTFTDASGREAGPGLLGAEPVVIVSGIARPAAFEASCLQADVDAVASIRFEDHNWYVEKDTDTIRSVMERTGSSRLVTTEKDIDKLPDELRSIAVVARADPEIDRPDRFWKVLEAAVGF